MFGRGIIIDIMLCLCEGGGCRRCDWVALVGLVEAAVGLRLFEGLCSGVALLLGLPSFLHPAGAWVDAAA